MVDFTMPPFPASSGAKTYTPVHIAQADALGILNRITGISARASGADIEYGLTPMVYAHGAWVANTDATLLDTAAQALATADVPTAGA